MSIETVVLPILKERLGIRSDKRKGYLENRIKGAIKQLEDDHEIVLESENYNHIMFLVDLVDWQYSNRDSYEDIPRHLRFRLHNLIIGGGGNGS